MPIFEYHCRSCDAQFEQLVRNPSESPEDCPQCGAGRPTRLLSVFGTGGGAEASGEDAAASCSGGGCGCGAGGCGCH